MERRRGIDEVGRVTDAKIRGNSPAHPAICLNGLVLAGWKPEFDPRQVLADPNDTAKVIDALQIAGIMPAEMAVFGAVNQSGDGLCPSWMGEAPEALFHCRFDVRKCISSAQGVTMEANSSRELLQEETEAALVGGERIPMARHLARVA